MAVAIEQFVKSLEQSGVISPSKLRAARENLPPECRRNAQELARELVRQKALTKYQVQEAYQGKAKNLVLGNYCILDKIGEGGMGQVFKARHRRMDRIVAIKMLPTGVANDQAAVARFEREVKAAAKLNHANIVTAFDADQAHGVHFLVMEYVEGTDLSVLVKRAGPLPVDQAVDFALQAARGLEYAHRHGVVHRDIKPANLLIDDQGTLKILDMGLARLDSAGTAQDQLTGTGQIMGTVDYMAPEQALDTRHADARADIYSLGITLWYLLTGRAAFGGESVLAKLLAHREQPVPSLQAARPETTPALDAVFTKMAAKKAEDRFQSMGEVIAELSRCRTGRTAPISLGDAQDEDSRLSDFLRGMMGSGTARAAPSGGPLAAKKRPPSPAKRPPALEATIGMSVPRVDTDPQTEQSLIAPAAGRLIGRLGVGPFWRRSPPGWRRGVLMACAAAAIVFSLAGIALFSVLFSRTKDATVRLELDDPAIEVVVAGAGATIKGATPEEIKLQPGEHSLRIRYHELEFETDKFVLKRGDTVTLKVDLPPGKVRVVEGDRVLGERPLAAVAPFDAKQANAYQEAWAEHLGVKVEISNSVGMKLRLVPPGEFTMGSEQAEIDALVQSTSDGAWQARFRSEAPRHRAHLTKAFYLGVHEVTQCQYQEVSGVNPSYYSAGGGGKDAVLALDTSEHPVEQVSWFDAVDFCDKLSEKEGLKPYYARAGETVTVLGGSGYRLPTEAEWEYACRAGTTTRWSFGDNETNLAQHAWYNANSGGGTHRTGELPANAYGLYDLHGNVWEWCWDWHGEYAAAEITDPMGPAAGGGGGRVLRGGSFIDIAPFVRSANRNTFRPDYRNLYSGFRAARTYP